MRTWISLLLVLVLGSSCAVNRQYSPTRKYAVSALREDFTLFRNILEESHPSLYWYTPKDSMDHYFDKAYARIQDSLTETQFRYLLSYVTSKVRCGHTSTMPSKAAARFAERTRSWALPFSVKAWPDTVVITSNLNRKDSVVKRGYVLRSIEGRPVQKIVDSFFSHLSTDGYNNTHKYQVLSNGSNFRSLYAGIYGLRRSMKVEYLDTAGALRSAMVDVYNPAADTPRVRMPQVKLSRRERKRLELQAARNLRFDTAHNLAIMEVSTFSKGRKLRSFFRQSFREIRKRGIQNLVVDVRGNGGGHVPLSNLLTRYIADKPFKIADSLYASRMTSKYAKYREQYFLNQLFFFFLTYKRDGGKYHFRLYEGRYFKPRRKDHFEGTTYILTGGNTFSAASLFAKALIGQEDVVVVGEETGGSAYGNTAWLIPDVTLPHTKVRFRLPLFRLVIDKDEVKGQSIVPEVPSLPTVDAIRKGIDFKLEKVKELIRASSQPAAGG